MQRTIRGAGLAIALTAIIAACATTSTATLGSLVPASRWQGDLRGTSATSFIGGDVKMEPFGTDSALVSVFILGADTTAALPWRLHQNECTSQTGRQIYNYTFKPIKASDDPDPARPSYGASTAIVPIRMPTTGIFAVEVLAPGSNVLSNDAQVIACGQLLPL